jgi:hypothetical protein
MSDWIKESDRQEQQIGVAANPMRWREIVALNSKSSKPHWSR